MTSTVFVLLFILKTCGPHFVPIVILTCSVCFLHTVVPTLSFADWSLQGLYLVSIWSLYGYVVLPTWPALSQHMVPICDPYVVLSGPCLVLSWFLLSYVLPTWPYMAYLVHTWPNLALVPMWSLPDLSGPQHDTYVLPKGSFSGPYFVPIGPYKALPWSLPGPPYLVPVCFSQNRLYGYFNLVETNFFKALNPCSFIK